MRLIIECPFGHELHATSWIDAEGNVRMIVSDCIVCAGVAHSNEPEEILNLLE